MHDSMTSTLSYQKPKNCSCYTQNSKQVLIVLMAKTSFNFEITSKISSLLSAINIMYWKDSSQIYCDTRFEFKLVKRCSEYLILLRTYINIYLICHQIIFKAKISKNNYFCGWPIDWNIFVHINSIEMESVVAIYWIVDIWFLDSIAYSSSWNYCAVNNG